LHAPQGFAVETIANVSAAREVAPLPNGDLLVGTQGHDVFIVPNAEGSPGSPQVFATVDDDEATGVTFVRARSEIYVATTHHVWAIAYHGERKAPRVVRIADVRTGPVAPGTDGDIHRTTSVAFTGGRLYAAAGSSCNGTMDGGRKPCTEPDPTRAAVSVMNPNGSGLTQRAKRIRNAIALAVNPQTGSLWVGGGGQDDLPFGHPYEYAFPSAYRGGLFAAVHGSWHKDGNGCSAEPPRVVFVAMDGDRPKKPVDWKDPTTQWTDFLTGFQTGCTTRIGRATGIAVGPKGSLFIADDDAGLVYRIRPSH
jgi:glucose/arabinose dehydrogenase